jgi:DnaJ-domain-containing protein 1
MQQRKSITLQQLLSEFDLKMDQVPDLSPSEDIETLKKNLEEFKKIIKSQYRKMVKKYHPDVASDKSLAHEKLIRLNELMKCVNLIKVQIHAPIQHTVYMRYSYTHYSGTTTTSTW